MEKLRILIVTSFYPPYHVGGACTHAYFLANGLAAAGHKVSVLYNKDAYALKRKGEPDKKAYPNHKNITLHEIATPLGKVGPALTYTTGLIPYPKDVQEVMAQDYDVIHYHNLSLFGPRILKMGKGPKIYTAHDHWLICPLNGFYRSGDICKRKPGSLTCSRCLLEHKRPPQFWRFGKLLQDGLAKLSLIITPSDYMKGFLEKHGITVPIAKVDNFVPDAASGEDRIDKLQQEPYFFFAGMLEETKGVKTLLRALVGTKHRVILAGSGSLQNWVKQFIKEHGLTHVHYVGFIPGNKIRSYFRHAKAFILPSSSPENAPLTILEAMAEGTPSIGSDVGGIPEMVRRIDKTLIIPRNDPKALRRVLQAFESKNYDAKQLKKVFQEHYTIGAFIRHYEQLLEPLLKE